ncbi:hypothetical protein [Devosia sp. RR2S18]|uniref:hypothetical protein n=1 Tax=Devosia rhizosphaerae TaxID=3049774 RepID=UPI002541F963|nr:hypothetical protein [Devosia sp. RR2S18]WIJ25880.1 hypothetical protein QOV41_03705 [Devosia sp. RR2S18]
MEKAAEGQYVVLFSSSEPSTTQTQSDQIFRAFKAAATRHHSDTPVGLTGFVADYDVEELKEQDAPAEALIGHLVRVEQEVQRAAEEERTAKLNARRVLYSPVVHSRKNIVVFSRCTLDGDAPQEQFAGLGGMQNQGTCAVSRSEFDALLLKKAIACSGGQLRTGGAPLALVPVNLSTLLSGASGDHYLSLLSAMPEQYRKLLMIEISGLPIGWTAPELSRAVVLISRYTKRVVVQLPLDTRHLAAVGEIGSWAISVDLSGCRSTDARLPSLLGQFTSAAFSCAMNSIAYGVDSTGLAALARSTGFLFISGSAAPTADAAQSAIGRKGR